MLVKGEVRGETVPKEGPRLEVPELVWKPQWISGLEWQWAWGLTPSTEYQNEFRLSCLSSQPGL